MYAQALTPSPPPPARLHNPAALALRAYEAVSDAIDLLGAKGSLKTVLAYLGGRRRALATAQRLPHAALYGVWRDGHLDPAHRTRVTHFGPGMPPYERVVDAYAYLYALKSPTSARPGALLAGTVRGQIAGQTFELTQYRCDLAGSTARNRRWLHTHWTQVPAIVAQAGSLFEMALEPLDDNAALAVVADLHWWLTHAVPFAYGSADINEWLVAYIFRLRGHGGVRFGQNPAALAFVAQSPEAYREAFAANLQFIPTRLPAAPMPAARQLAHDARQGLRRRVKALLRDLDPSIAEPTGFTALHLAAREGHGRVVALLLRYGADVHAVLPDSRQTALHLAAGQGQTWVVQALLKCGAAPQVMDAAGQTSLHLALARGHLGVVKCLLAFGAPLSLQDAAGNTPLHLAALLPSPKALVRLLRGKDAQKSSALANARGETPLSLAALAGNVATLRKLVRYGAPPPQTALGDDTLHPILAELSMAVVELGADLHLFGLIVRSAARGQVATTSLLTAALVAAVPRRERRALQQVVQTSVAPGH